MSNASDFFGHDDTFVTPIFVLLLFVISATVTSLLVLGKPVSLFLAGSKKEAFMLLFSTLVWLVVFLLTVALIMFNFK
jgi:maltodextrin utilization protein YvdJ